MVNILKPDWAAVWIRTLGALTKHVSPVNFEKNVHLSVCSAWCDQCVLPKVNCVWTLCLSCKAAGPNQESKTSMGKLGVFELVLFGWGGPCPPMDKKVSNIQELHPKSFSCLLVQKLFQLEESTESSKGRKIILEFMKMVLCCPMLWKDLSPLWILLQASVFQPHHSSVRMPAKEVQWRVCRVRTLIAMTTWAMLKLCIQSIPNQQVLWDLENSRIKCYIWADHTMVSR